MTKIKRETYCYAVYINDIKLESYGFDYYGEHNAEQLAKAFANGFDCGCDAKQRRPELFGTK